jgi:hypothetical protein
MCMSFFDLPIGRQEEIWVQTIGYANAGRDTKNSVSRYWEYRRESYEAFLREKYAGMDAAELTARKAQLEADHRNNPEWAPVIDAVTNELKTRAERGSML